MKCETTWVNVLQVYFLPTFNNSFASSPATAVGGKPHESEWKGKPHRSDLLTVQQQALRIEHQTISRSRKKVCNVAGSFESAQLKETLVRPERLSDKFSRSCFSLGSHDNGLKEWKGDQSGVFLKREERLAHLFFLNGLINEERGPECRLLRHLDALSGYERLDK